MNDRMDYKKCFTCCYSCVIYDKDKADKLLVGNGSSDRLKDDQCLVVCEAKGAPKGMCQVFKSECPHGIW